MVDGGAASGGGAGIEHDGDHTEPSRRHPCRCYASRHPTSRVMPGSHRDCRLGSRVRGLPMNDDVAVPASALEALPIFPLRGVVLFPGGLLPLHVFEPRYRAMLRDCLATHRCMAMAFVLDDDPAVDATALPRIAEVAGVGLVAHHTMLDDGRSNIVLEGRARVALDELPFAPPYRRARARILDDIQTPVAPHDVTGLFAVATAFAAATHQTDFMLPSGVGPGRAAESLCAQPHRRRDYAAASPRGSRRRRARAPGDRRARRAARTREPQGPPRRGERVVGSPNCALRYSSALSASRASLFSGSAATACS